MFYAAILSERYVQEVGASLVYHDMVLCGIGLHYLNTDSFAGW